MSSTIIPRTSPFVPATPPPIPHTPWRAKAPLFVLAPMEGVTDVVFRAIIDRVAPPDVFFTEFTNVEGLASRGRDRVIHRLRRGNTARPVIAQLWGEQPANFTAAGKLAVDLGFDGIDLNMGCPERGVVARGSCAALIERPDHAARIIAATRAGAGRLPVSVKTRLGVRDWRTTDWISHLLRQDLSALTVHARIASEMSNFPARWTELPTVTRLRDELAPQTVIIGNGDVQDRVDAAGKIADTGIDGVMIGRGIFADPWVFAPQKHPVDTLERVRLVRDHVAQFDATWGRAKNFNLMKKFYKMYVHGTPGGADLRLELMSYDTASDTLSCLDKAIAGLLADR